MNIEKVTQLPENFQGINPHNLYLYVKAYLANLRAGTAHTKTRAEVSGTGKKPFRQKGLGRARQGSFRAPQFVGGGVAHGPRSNRNWSQKINKKQKRAALRFAINEKAENGKLYVVDSIKVESGKTKDANAIFNQFNERDILFVTSSFDEKTFLAFRNLNKAYLIHVDELNAYLASTFHAIVMDKDSFEKVKNKG